MSINLPKLSAIHSAILAAPEHPPSFPFAALNDPETRESFRQAQHLQPYLHDMRAEAERAQALPLEPLSFHLFHLFETTGERVTYERAYFDRRRRLAGLALISVIDENDAYLPTLHELIWEICNEYTWALPAHLPVGIDAVTAYRVPPGQVVDLFAAETAHALAEVLHLLGERLDAWLQYRIRSEIERRVFQPMFHTPQRFHWEIVQNNWAAVCGGCVGMAALLLENERNRLVGMIDRLMRTLECFLEGFGSDGGCPEGIGYWVYGFGYFTYFAEMLYTFTEGKLDLLQNEHVRQVANFPGVISLGHTNYINYSDAPDTMLLHSGLCSYLSKRLSVSFPDLAAPNWRGEHVYRWGHITRDLLWTDASLLNQAVDEGRFYLDALEWVVDRHIWDDITVAFSAKGGHNNESHNHNDLGHFILHIGGESILADLGAGVYTRQYFAKERYDLIHNGSQGHSVPLINGKMQSAGSKHKASVLHCALDSDNLRFELDLTRAYDDVNLRSFTRSFDWLVNIPQKSAKLILTDHFDFADASAKLEECFISLIAPQVDKGLIRWQGQAGTVSMTYDVEQFEAYVEIIETQTHLTQPITVYRLRLRASKSTKNRQDSFIFDVKYAGKV